MAPDGEFLNLMAAIRKIEADLTLTDAEKAKQRQDLMGGKIGGDEKENKDAGTVFGDVGGGKGTHGGFVGRRLSSSVRA